MIILGIYGGMGVVSFVVMGVDKRAAEKGKWRISERTLHIIELLGGVIGSWVGQMVFRHKTRKLSYQALFWGIFLVHVASWVWIYRTYIR